MITREIITLPPGYTQILTSQGVMVDFTPPFPGPLSGTLEDDYLHEDCTDFLPDHFDHRCAVMSPNPNYR